MSSITSLTTLHGFSNFSVHITKFLDAQDIPPLNLVNRACYEAARKASPYAENNKGWILGQKTAQLYREYQQAIQAEEKLKTELERWKVLETTTASVIVEKQKTIIGHCVRKLTANMLQKNTLACIAYRILSFFSYFRKELHEQEFLKEQVHQIIRRQDFLKREYLTAQDSCSSTHTLYTEALAEYRAYELDKRLSQEVEKCTATVIDQLFGGKEKFGSIPIFDLGTKTICANQGRGIEFRDGEQQAQLDPQLMPFPMMKGKCNGVEFVLCKYIPLRGNRPYVLVFIQHKPIETVYQPSTYGGWLYGGYGDVLIMGKSEWCAYENYFPRIKEIIHGGYEALKEGKQICLDVNAIDS